jgi:hypothetical protein
VLRKIYGLKRDEIITAQYGVFHNLYSLPSIIRMIKSRMRWAGHVTQMGRKAMHTRFWWESQKERDH